MKKVNQNMVDALTLKDKERLLKELKQEDLLNLFKNKYKQTYKPIEQKRTSLDQQISISIASNEKELIARELQTIRQIGPAISISSYVRNKANTQVDIAEWYNKAVEGLRQLTSDNYDEKKLIKQKNQYLKLMEDVEEGDKESEYYYTKKIQELNGRLEEVQRVLPNRSFRLSGRVTFNEANMIRWRAARLNISVADYMRFMLFNYLPFTEADRYMTLDARKRFYISIIDIYRNGWGNPPAINECPNCARYLHDIRVLRDQLERYKKMLEAKQ